MLHRLFSLLFPTSCAGCGSFGAAICDRCAAGLPLAEQLDFPHAFAIYAYGHPIVERAIHDLKYRRKSELAQSLIALALPHLHYYIYEQLQGAAPQPICLVPMPQHRARSRKRGYNQSELIARAIAASDASMRITPLLRKIRNTGAQARIKRRDERLQNLVGSMRAVRQLDPHGIYLIIDDITTTGATFIEASRALRVAGARQIICFAIAHGYKTPK